MSRAVFVRGSRPRGLACVLGIVALLFSNAKISAQGARSPLPRFTSEQVLAPTAEPVGPRSAGAATLRAQIRLDRARFSPGELDGRYGANLRHALRAYQKAMALPVTGTVDIATWQALDRDTDPVLARYRLSEADVAGPFQPVPEDMMEKSRLPALGFASVAEAIGERFHASPELLGHLNLDGAPGEAGQQILVPNVHPPGKVEGAEHVVVDKSDSTVSLRDAQGRVLAQFPATTGSRHDPLPIGQWKINGVGRNPEFNYNPDLFWDARADHEKAVIRPGPNNPVGVVWVDLSKKHYGIHGTPEPSKIGKTHSHGCIRLTNWDAATLGDSVAPGMPALLQP